MGAEDRPFLETRNLRKSFGHVQALQGTGLSASRGRILAIVGENGAGKSTLIKIISGVIFPDSGSLTIEGKKYTRLDPHLAGKLGISTVYQDLSLVDSLSVWENMFLGHEYHRAGWLNKKKMRSDAIKLLSDFRINIPDIDARVGDLSGGQRQAAAVARALLQGGKLLIFDEPTAAMGIRETGMVEQLILSLPDRGIGVIIISHNMQQVFNLADTICVMKLGRVIAEKAKESVTPEEVAAMIVSGVA